MAKVLLNLQGTSQTDDLVSSFPINGVSITCADVSYVDDVAMNIAAPASEIIDKSVCVAGVCYNSFGMLWDATQLFFW